MSVGEDNVEVWDIYNENRERTGRTIIRGEKLHENEYHLVVHIWIINSKGEFLIQKRASTVSSNPNMWAITGGSAIKGEDSYTACQRELYEEVGLKAEKGYAEIVLSLKRENNFCDVWFIQQDFSLEECKLQVEEVSEVKWATIQEIRKLIAQGKFNTYYYLEEIIKIAQITKNGHFA
ncbi:NUDIX hydrolase [Neobacillus sp. D3-1R]|uniref:NUDIX hydrolase n=1 Tax=Neobacillus sp. D3-1R TaxID=3445778 RepID=UPI003FA12655